MPNRILRAAIRQSRRWNQLTFLQQSFYIRLLTLVDDYGRYEAHPQLLASECFPYGDDRGSQITCTAIAEHLRSICTARMAIVYENEGNLYLQLTRWKEHARSASKFPEPSAEQLRSNCCALEVQMITSPPSPSPSLSPTPTPSQPVLITEPPKPLPHQKANGEWHPDPVQIRLNALFKRKPTTRWDPKELKVYKSISPVDDADLRLLESYYSASIPHDRDYRRRDLPTLLNNFRGEVDRARGFGRQSSAPVTIGNY